MCTKQRTTIVGLLLIVVLVLAVAPSAAQDGPPQVGLRPDAPPYALHGPYWVGTRDFSIEEVREVPLQVHAWYPALNPSGAPEEIAYTAVLKDNLLPGVGPDVNIYGHALQDAGMDAATGPYPLVVFSHGFGASAFAYAHLTEHFASYGFVVLAPEHQESFDMEFTGFPASSIDRPRDVVDVLDLAETLTAAGGPMEGMIDMDRVAVAGHSSGGYTTLAMGGARYDLAAFNARCDALPEDDPNKWLCSIVEPFEADMAAMAGLDPMPEGLWPSFGDPRVDVILPMAGDSYLFDKAGLAAITIPVMALGGTADTGTPFEWGAHPTYQYASSSTKVLVAFENAEHMIFGESVEDAPYLVGTFWEPFYMDVVWDKARVHDLIHHFSTAFLLAELKGDADAAAALAPGAVQFPGITYDSQGF